MHNHDICVSRVSGSPVVTFPLSDNAGGANPVITADSISLKRDGRRWLGVMGEIHYARVDASAWMKSLARMKAGGLDVIASYVFWIHHEETEGRFDWTGSRDLRRFVECCAALRLPVIIRCGPWCHGEVRNGGLPDWILTRKPRTLDESFLSSTRRLYEQIADQLRGLLWRDGGPVIGIQVDNEFGGPAEYLLKLKSMARDVGLHVPIYTRTGWPSTSTAMPFGELFPLFGAYAEGFWDRDLVPMPGNYWRGFCFETMRTDVQIGFDQLGEREAKDDEDTPQYPYLTCELGGGMEQSYHRRILIDPRDILAVAITRIGSGSNLPGYYMYHGGVNPSGTTSLHESQATGYWNDVPQKSYDFQAPLGSFGQTRRHYHLLRRLHMFLGDFGELLAPMRTTLPEKLPNGRDDADTLRFAVRGDADGGFLFINNHQRHLKMKPHVDVRFSIAHESEDARTELPLRPLTIPANASFIWPMGLDLGVTRLRHATAQLVCKITSGNDSTYYFASTHEGRAEFVFDACEGLQIETAHAHERLQDGARAIWADSSSQSPAITMRHADNRSVRIVLLDDADSLRLWKLKIENQEQAILSDDDLWIDETGRVRGGRMVRIEEEVDVRCTRVASEARPIRIGPLGVAEAPAASAYASAAEYVIRIPPRLDRANTIVRIEYIGDVLRFLSNDELLLDDFYNGDAADFALSRLPSHMNELTIQILPLRSDAPILLLARDAKAGTSNQTCELKSATLLTFQSNDHALS